MQPSPTVQRLVTLLIALLVAFLLSSVFSPPDPFTQLLHVGLLTVLAYPVAAQLQQWV
jgi:Sec-independent protein secretion pathway component TatC